MKVNAVFIFIGPGANPKEHRTAVDTPGVTLNVVGVSTYAEAEAVAVEFANKGVGAIELCGGFGNEGIAKLAKAVKGKAHVGAVKFDCHPGLEFKSGDEFFL